VLYLAAVLIVASVALFVAAPLGGGLRATQRAGRDAAERERLEHERALAMQGLRELEFDREMGKLSETDYAALREGLMRRALGASAALERLRAATAPALAAAGGAASYVTCAPQAVAPRPRLVRSLPAAGPTPEVSSAAAGSATAAPAAPARIRFCPQCGAEVAAGNFCSECGEPLSVSARAGARAER
jgi:cytochrome c-type biogenesis protein CcmI